MFRRTFNAQVSQNHFSTRFWVTLNLMETFRTHLFSNSPAPPKKYFRCQCPNFHHLLWKHFAIDKATCLNTQVHFYFQLSQNEISTRFWMTPIDTAILVTAETAITIWQKTGTDSRRRLERVYLHTAYRTVDVARPCQGGWTEHTQQLMNALLKEVGLICDSFIQIWRIISEKVSQLLWGLELFVT